MTLPRRVGSDGELTCAWGWPANARADKAAQFENVVPIPAVPSDPRRLETKRCTDVAGTQPRDQTLEPGPRHRATGLLGDSQN